jgi:hypothetical protein
MFAIPDDYSKSDSRKKSVESISNFTPTPLSTLKTASFKKVKSPTPSFGLNTLYEKDETPSPSFGLTTLNEKEEFEIPIKKEDTPTPSFGLNTLYEKEKSETPIKKVKSPTPSFGLNTLYEKEETPEKSSIILIAPKNTPKTPKNKTKKITECKDGKERHPKTNRCVLVCKPGCVRNEDGKCVKAPKAKKEKVCEEGKVLNPKTNRCIKDKTVKTVKKCEDGKELNPKTNRCVKTVKKMVL